MNAITAIRSRHTPATSYTPTPMDLDVELIRLCARCISAARKADRLHAAVEREGARAGTPDWVKKMQPVYELISEGHDLKAKIARTPARTPAGNAAKAQVVRINSIGLSDPLGASLARDIIRGAARTEAVSAPFRDAASYPDAHLLRVGADFEAASAATDEGLCPRMRGRRGRSAAPQGYAVHGADGKHSRRHPRRRPWSRSAQWTGAAPARSKGPEDWAINLRHPDDVPTSGRLLLSIIDDLVALARLVTPSRWCSLTGCRRECGNGVHELSEAGIRGDRAAQPTAKRSAEAHYALPRVEADAVC